MSWIRVEDKDTGHQYDIRDDTFDESVHKRLDLKAYPELTGDGDRPRPAKPRVTVPPAASRRARKATTRKPRTASAPADRTTSTTTTSSTPEAGQPANQKETR